MTLLLAYSVVLLMAVLVSALAHRTVLSTAVLFLAAGFVLGDELTGVISFGPNDEIVSTLAELALFAVLFTDGMRVGWRDLRSAWRLPGRALGWGLPLTLLATALLAHYVAGLGWVEALLIGAVLAPTDPVFAAALVGNEKVPRRLRHLLNVESGLNDGLALPIVIVLLEIAHRSHDLHVVELGVELVLGVVIGVTVPWVAIRLERSRWFSAAEHYQAINAVAIGLLVFSLGTITDGNLFLAAFAAGITVATIGHQEKKAFHEFGDLIAELLKLAALLVFGALISPSFPGWDPLDWMGLRPACPRGRPASGTLDFVLAVRSQRSRAGSRHVVRSEGLRLGRVRVTGTQQRNPGRRRDLPSGGADYRFVDRGALILRRAGRPPVRRGA